MSQVANTILSLHGWAALAVVFALPALESSAFIGFVFPGEVAVLLGGVLAFQHRISLAAALAAAILGAVVGDTIGYAVGRKWGERILRGTLGRFIKDHHLDRAKSYLARRGGRAVFVGRFTAALRVLIPGLAGMSGLPYRTFAIANFVGGAIWAAAFVLLGFAAGESWRQAEDVARQAGLALLAIVAVIVVIAIAARWLAQHQDVVQGFLARQRRRPTVQRIVSRYERQLRFLAGRVRPEGALGLSLTLGLVTIVVFGGIFARIVNLVAGDQVSGADRHVHQWVVEHQSSDLNATMRLVSALGSGQVLIPLVLVVGAAWWLWRRSPRPLLLLAGAYGGAFALVVVIRHLVDRSRPPVPPTLSGFMGSAFPSGHTTEAVAVYGALAAVIAGATGRWSAKVACWTAALLTAGLVGLSRLYLSAHWLTDVLGGVVLGLLWLVLLLTTARILIRRPPDRRAQRARSVSREMMSLPRM